MKKTIYLLVLIPSLLFAFGKNDSNYQDLYVNNIVKQIKEDNPKPNKTVLVLEEGDYRGIWNTKASNGKNYLGLKLTARISKKSDTEYTGSLYISKDFTSCCKTKGDYGDGLFILKVSGDKITFKWIDEIPNCEGIFTGTATIENNKIVIGDLIGNDCDGDHKGSIELFK